MILKLTKEINREVRSTVMKLSTIMKICANGVCDIGIVEQYKACCPCHFIIDNYIMSFHF